jgi:large repetitive protein
LDKNMPELKHRLSTPIETSPPDPLSVYREGERHTLPVSAGDHGATVKIQSRRISALLVFGMCLMLLGVALLVVPVKVVVAQQEPTPFPLYALPDSRLSVSIASNTLALTKDNRILVAANTFSNSLSVLDLPQPRLRVEIAVGTDPRSVALTADGTRAVTANRGDGTLSLVDLASQTVTPIDLNGVYPYGVVVGEDDRAYVSLQGSDEVAVVDLNQRVVLARVPTPDSPAGLALWGDFLYVTHFWSGQVSLIYIPDARVVKTITTGLDTGLSQAIEIDITRGVAYVPQTRSNAQNATPTFDTLVFPVVNRVELRNLSLLREQRIALDTADQPVNMPFGVALDRFRRWLYIANAGSNSLSVIDLETGLARGHVEVGSNPRGVLLSRDNGFVYVNNALEGTLTVIETRNLTVLDNVPISDFNIPVDTIVAAELFYGTSDERMSFGNWVSCANCHFDGASDGRVWNGFSDGPRNTAPLYNLLETSPYSWSGSWDELADVELKIRSMQAGTGLIDGSTISPASGDPHGGQSFDLDTLTAYLAGLSGPPNPVAYDPALVQRGAVVFAEQQCSQCHAGAAGTDLQRHDVGTGGSPLEEAGSEFDTPSLRWLWATAPYFHDGSAATLRDVFLLPGRHELFRILPLEDIDALVSYLLILPQG